MSMTLVEQRDHHGLRYVGAELDERGDLVVSGHDLGRGVEEILGRSEYEWIIKTSADALPRLAALLDTDVDGLLARLAERFSGSNAFRLRSYLEQHGLVHDRFSWISD